MANAINSNSVLASGIEGFRNASSGVTEAARSIAGLSTESTTQDSTNLTSDLISLQSNTIGAQAAAQVIDVADETVGSIIDIFA